MIAKMDIEPSPRLYIRGRGRNEEGRAGSGRPHPEWERNGAQEKRRIPGRRGWALDDGVVVEFQLGGDGSGRGGGPEGSRGSDGKGVVELSTVTTPAELTVAMVPVVSLLLQETYGVMLEERLVSPVKEAVAIA